MAIPPSFWKKHAKSMFFASASFGFSHGIEEFVSGMSRSHISDINLTVFLVLIPFELIQSFVFFILCVTIMALPVREIYRRLLSIRLIKFIFIGICAGILFIPLCALVAYLVLPLPDAPGYLARCIEFGLPMTVAGAVGGYVFGREVDGFNTADKSITTLFS